MNDLTSSDITPKAKVTNASEVQDDNYYPFWQPELYINLLVDHSKYSKSSQAAIPPEIAKALKTDLDKNAYEPIIYLSDFWNLQKNMVELNETLDGTNLNLTLNFQMFWPMYF